LSVDFTVLGGLTVFRPKTVGGFYTWAFGENRLTTAIGLGARINPAGMDLAWYQANRMGWILVKRQPIPLWWVTKTGMAGSVANFVLGLQEMINRRRAHRRRDSRLRLAAQVLALMIVAVGILDVVSTNASIAAGGTETNALIAALMTQLGVWWFVPKLAVHVMVAAFVLWLPSRGLIWKARACVMVYTLIIATNFYIADWAII
jgi:hypothetical protein